jgi:hypothetical protein
VTSNSHSSKRKTEVTSSRESQRKEERKEEPRSKDRKDQRVSAKGFTKENVTKFAFFRSRQAATNGRETDLTKELADSVTMPTVK